jgi:hypothetical protein
LSKFGRNPVAVAFDQKENTSVDHSGGLAELPISLKKKKALHAEKQTPKNLVPSRCKI